MKTISHEDFEIFTDNYGIHTSPGCKWVISDNAYISVVATNNCQCSCPYCINSCTDRSMNLPIEKAIRNIEILSEKYIKRHGSHDPHSYPGPEVIVLGGEPTLHPNFFGLIEELGRLYRHNTIWRVRLTTNGIKLRDRNFLKELVETDLYGINISWHNDKNFMPLEELEDIVKFIHSAKYSKKVRVNTNIYRGNNDDVVSMIDLAKRLSFADSIRFSNVIHKNNFTVNSVNNRAANNLILSDEEYEDLFTKFIESYENSYSIFCNPHTLGFVRYYMIPTPCPIIVNWNINSKVSEQIDEKASGRINTFKCLVTGDISLSWSTDNIVNIEEETY